MIKELNDLGEIYVLVFQLLLGLVACGQSMDHMYIRMVNFCCRLYCC